MHGTRMLNRLRNDKIFVFVSISGRKRTSFTAPVSIVSAENVKRIFYRSIAQILRSILYNGDWVQVSEWTDRRTVLRLYRGKCAAIRRRCSTAKCATSKCHTRPSSQYVPHTCWLTARLQKQCHDWSLVSHATNQSLQPAAHLYRCQINLEQSSGSLYVSLKPKSKTLV